MTIRTLITILFAAVSAATAAPTIQPPAPPSNWTDGFVWTNGIRMHYWRTGGEKPALVLAHGSSDDGLCWTALAKELESRYDVIMIDARGHGLSDPPKPGDPVDAQADDLAGLIRALNLSKPIVMGHSMGASASAMFGAKYPDMARAIVLEDPGLLPRPAGAPGPGGAQQGTPEERIAAAVARNNRSLDELVAGCMKNSPSWGRTECEIWAPSKRLHHPLTGVRGPGARPAMTDLFAKITVPLLIIKADAPADVRKQNEAVAAKLAHGTIVHIDKAGHNVRREQKEPMLKALNQFLAKIESGR